MDKPGTLRHSDNKNFRDVLYTIDKRGRRKWVYPALIKGWYFKRRTVVAYLLVIFYVSLPWITVADKQAVFFDLFNRQFTFFGLTLWATDTVVLALILAGLGISLFFFTSLFGRVWCGWACPETVFLEFIFRPIERFIEGGPVQRQRLDAMPWSLEKIRKKLLKHLLCATAAWVLATTTLAIFYGREPLLAMMSDWPWNHPFPFFMTLVIMTVLAFQFGWFREQFCTVLCPYARFQSVLMDSQSLGVGYDVIRGEPRGKLSKKESPSQSVQLGDCIDCGLCVRVCPTGIDIRNGNQLECIHCTQCIDACDSIMKKIGRRQGLIRIDSEKCLLEGSKSTRRVSPRTVVYAILMLIYTLLLTYVLLTRAESDIKVVRASVREPFQKLSATLISNQFQIRISNKSSKRKHYRVEHQYDDIDVILPGQPVTVKPGEIVTYPVFVNIPLSSLNETGKRSMALFLYEDNSLLRTQEIIILGPGR